MAFIIKVAAFSTNKQLEMVALGLDSISLVFLATLFNLTIKHLLHISISAVTKNSAVVVMQLLIQVMSKWAIPTY